MAAYDPSGLPDMGAADGNQNGEYEYNPEDAGDEDDDYDPSSFSFGDNGAQQDPAAPDQTHQSAHAATESLTTEQASKPKTVGGFIVEESDDEEDDDTAVPPPSQLNGTEGAQSGLGAVAVSEAAQDVSLASEPTQDSAAAQVAQASLNGSTAATPAQHVSNDVASTPAFTVPLPTQQQGKQEDISPAAAGTTSVSATPKPSINGVTASADNSSAVPPTPTTQRLPHDKVGRLEDRIKDDPKADTQAWLELIQHYRDKEQTDNVRRVYDRMLEVFPTTPTLWTSYLSLETQIFDRTKIDTLFGAALPTVPSVDLWSMYLDYLRRAFPLIPDPQGQNRAIITQGFDAVLDAVGIDPDSGKLWREYVEFAKSGPGVVGGSGWQDQQKGDIVRRAYQRAVKVPMSELTKLWKEYDSFEMAVNKTQARKILHEYSPHYMTARGARNDLERLVLERGLDRRSLPILPPVYGHEGEDAFAAQVELWRTWIEFEKTDPVALREDEMPLYRKRILYVLKQATIQLRFYPEIWFQAAQWCFEQAATEAGAEELAAQGDEFLEQGIKANPESVLLALKKADRLEQGLDMGDNSEATVVANGERLDAVFEDCHKALYALRVVMGEREKKAIAAIREHFASLPAEEEAEQMQQGEEDEEDEDSPTIAKPKTRQEQMQAQIKSLTTISRSRLEELKKTISYVWVAKMRAFRRVQGQGAPGKPRKGFRGVFGEARPRGQLSSEVYVASALTEWFCYRDASALKIFERGLKLFPSDEGFAGEYVRFLVEQKGDLVNARVVFETTMTKILGPAQQQGQQQVKDNGKVDKEAEEEERKKKDRVRPLLGFMHEFESRYGDMAQILKLERRMKDLFPEEPEIVRFGSRFTAPNFDGLGVQLVLSETQVRSKMAVPAAFVQQPPPAGFMPTLQPPGMGSPDQGALRLGPNGPYVASPKRPLDDGDSDMEHQRKFIRGESPLKGAAGRRVAGGGQQTVLGHMSTGSTSGQQQAGGAGGFMTKNYVPSGAAGMPPPQLQQQQPVGPPPLPRDVLFLLSILPNTAQYQAVLFEPNRMVDLLRGMNVESARPRANAMAAAAVGGGGGGYGGGR